MAQNKPDFQPGLHEVLVTPDMAADLLSTKADFQRSISMRTVKKFADEMIRGQWRYVPSLVISISFDGEIVDGQHRLQAVLLSGMPQKFMVHYGACANDFSVID